MDRDNLITAIEQAAERHGLAPATITSRGARNSRLYHRLKRGGDCTTKIANRLLHFIQTLPDRREAS